MKILFAFVAIIFIALFIRNILMLFLSLENYNMHKKRFKQMQKNKQKEDADLSGFVDAVTKPIIQHIFSRLKPRNLDELERQLTMAKWRKNMNPIQFRAIDLLLKFLGLFFGTLLWNESNFIAIVWGGVLFFGFSFLMKNSYNNRKDRLIIDFPDFIRVTEGYLSANLPFAKAVTEAIRYVGPEWRPILQQFAVDIEISGADQALNKLKKEVDIFEVREFVALIRLTLEQGGDAGSSFRAQAEKIREMQLDMIAIKIGKRQMMGVILQGPLLLAAMAVFGLPTVGAMMNLGI